MKKENEIIKELRNLIKKINTAIIEIINETEISELEREIRINERTRTIVALQQILLKFLK